MKPRQRKVERTLAQQVNIKRIKTKIFEYIHHMDYSLDQFYKVMVTGSEREISKQSFVNAMKNKILTLDEHDLEDMFYAIDLDRSGYMNWSELQAEFADVQIALIFQGFYNDKLEAKKLF